MGDAHQQLAVWREDAPNLVDRTAIILDVHQDHRRENNIEIVRGKRLQITDIGTHEFDSVAGFRAALSGRGDQLRTSIDADDLRSAGCELPAVSTLSATEIEYPSVAHISQHFECERHEDEVSIVIFVRMPYPILRDGVPCARGTVFEFRHVSIVSGVARELPERGGIVSRSLRTHPVDMWSDTRASTPDQGSRPRTRCAKHWSVRKE